MSDGRLVRVPGSNGYRLSYALRRAILLQNIWGVDIDPLAVEVTKFSLFLKLLEDTSAEEIDAYARVNSDYILPSLEGNIKNGNSLVGPSYARFDPDVYERDGALEEIRIGGACLLKVPFFQGASAWLQGFSAKGFPPAYQSASAPFQNKKAAFL